MLVYGDHGDRADARALTEELRARIGKRGCDCWALVESGRLVQGLLDAEAAAHGADECTPLSERCASLMLALARRESFRARGALAGLASCGALPSRIRIRTPEGYAFYAIYPDLYAEAARTLEGPVQAIGIRSIGTSLAAAVAASCGGPAALSVRPVGHPFRRELRLGSVLQRRLAPELSFAIVDEGPGLSGSSFLCVARELIARGVPGRRIHLFPSHCGGPGAEARASDRALWEDLPRHWRSFETLLAQVPRWCEDLTGVRIEPLQEVSGGRWRAVTNVAAPANVKQERRKLLLRTGRGSFLLKFAGLGKAGEAVFRRARTLADAGFSPPVLGLRNGFLIHRWLEARPPEEGPAFLDRVAEYVAFRSRALPAAADSGASPQLLLEMARRNGAIALGNDDAKALDRWSSHLDALARDVVRVETDNRMHRWEWLQAGEGPALKADSADHCRAHDLVGCQDAAWDLAGASIELDLAPDELLRRFRAHGGRGAASEVLAFFRACYLAFQLGAFSLAADAAPTEAAMLRAAADRYRDLLRDELRS